MKDCKHFLERMDDLTITVRETIVHLNKICVSFPSFTLQCQSANQPTTHTHTYTPNETTPPTQTLR